MAFYPLSDKSGPISRGNGANISSSILRGAGAFATDVRAWAAEVRSLHMNVNASADFARLSIRAQSRTLDHCKQCNP
jgi:hypothetical protein